MCMKLSNIHDRSLHVAKKKTKQNFILIQFFDKFSSAVEATFRAMLPNLQVDEVKDMNVNEQGDFAFITCQSTIAGAHFK